MIDITKLYPRLTPDERLRLTVAAMARGDERETLSLMMSCPRHLYKITDDAYLDRVETLRVMALTVLVDLLNNALAVSAQIGLAALLSSRHAGTKWNPESEEIAVLDKVIEKRSVSLATLKGVSAGWEDFCHEIGLDPYGVLKAFWFELPRPVLGLLELAGSPDEKVRQQYRDVHRNCWAKCSRESDHV